MEPEIDCVDIDPEETSEWLDAMQAVLAHEMCIRDRSYNQIKVLTLDRLRQYGLDQL